MQPARAAESFDLLAADSAENYNPLTIGDVSRFSAGLNAGGWIALPLPGDSARPVDMVARRRRGRKLKIPTAPQAMAADRTTRALMRLADMRQQARANSRFPRQLRDIHRQCGLPDGFSAPQAATEAACLELNLGTPLRQIADGLSSTMALAECLTGIDSQYDIRGVFWYDHAGTSQLLHAQHAEFGDSRYFPQRVVPAERKPAEFEPALSGRRERTPPRIIQPRRGAVIRAVCW